VTVKVVIMTASGEYGLCLKGAQGTSDKEWKSTYNIIVFCLATSLTKLLILIFSVTTSLVDLTSSAPVHPLSALRCLASFFRRRDNLVRPLVSKFRIIFHSY
jgi:hypothetical protein